MKQFSLSSRILQYHLPYVFLLIITCMILLYRSSFSATDWWNSGFYASCAYSLGIPGPGDSILFIILGRIAVILFPFLPVAKALALVNIGATIGAAVLLYYTLLILFHHLQPDMSNRIIPFCAFITAISLPFLCSVWSNALGPNGYALGLLLSSLLLFLSVKMYRENDIQVRMRLFLIIAFIMGLDCAAHRLNNPFFPVLIVIAVSTLRRNLLNWRFAIAIITLFLLGYSLHLYLLIRGRLAPDVDQGFVFSWADLMSWIRMGPKGESNLSILFHRRAPLIAYQINHMYLRYLGWNFFGRNSQDTHVYSNYLALIPGILGSCGIVYSFMKRKRTALLLLFAFFSSSLFLVLYLNIWNDFFREIDRLFLASFLLFQVWVGIGTYTVINWGIHILRYHYKNPRFPIALLLFMAIFVLPANLIKLNWRRCDKNGYFFAEDWAYNLLQSCDHNALLFTNGDNDTYPLWFCQNCAGIRNDVTVVNLSLLNVPQYAAILRRPLPDVFAKITDAELYGISHHLNHTADDCLITLPKTGLQIICIGQGKKPYITISDSLLIRIIEENNWKHPVYFSITCNHELHKQFTPYISLCGLAYRLYPQKQKDLNVAVSEKLCTQIFRYRNIDNPSVWIDKNDHEIEPAVEIFKHYRFTLNKLYDYYRNETANNTKARELHEFTHKKIPDWRFTPSQLSSFDEIEHQAAR